MASTLGFDDHLASTSARNEPCLYSRHVCTRTRFENYKYCVKHVLEDENSPFTSCEYMSRTSKRKCPNPALRQGQMNMMPTFCEEHLRDLQVKERHQKLKKKLRKKKRNEKRQQAHPDEAKRTVLINQLLKYSGEMMKGSSSSHLRQKFDSELEEEVHRPVTDDWLLETPLGSKTNADWDDFDPVNNEVYEPLRYADVLTPEEVVATAQSKLIRLQSLYIEQFKRLFHLLKERRRQFVHESRQEDKEMKNGKNPSSSLTDTELYDMDEIRALTGYRKRCGVEALLRKQQKKRRMDASSGQSNISTEHSQTQPRCSHVSSHSRCRGLCLPYTKFCTSHILEDPHQLLYKKCNTANCPTPVCRLAPSACEVVQNDNDTQAEECYCIIHAPLPELTFKFSMGCEEKCNDAEKQEAGDDKASGAVVDVVEDGHTKSINTEDTAMEVDELQLCGNQQLHMASDLPSCSNAKTIVSDTQPAETDVRHDTLEQNVAEIKFEPHNTSDQQSDNNAVGDVGKMTSSHGNDSALTAEENAASIAAANCLTIGSSFKQASSESVESPSPVDEQPVLADLNIDAPVNTDGTIFEDSSTLPTNASMDAPSFLPSGDEMKNEGDLSEDLREKKTELSPQSTQGVSSSDASSQSCLVSRNEVEHSTGILTTCDSSSAVLGSTPPLSESSHDCLGKEDKALVLNSNAGATSTVSSEAGALPKAGKEQSDFTLDPETGLMVGQEIRECTPSLEYGQDDVLCIDKIEQSGPSISHEETNSNNNSSKGYKDAADLATDTSAPVLSARPVLSRQQSFSGRSERKPSSADEEMAVVSLLSLCTRHPSDENSHSSSTDQE